MKNILIIILILLLVWVAYGYISKDQIKELGSTTMGTIKKITTTNLENIKEGKDLKDFFNSNLDILKDYWIDNFETLSKDDESFNETIKNKILEKYNISKIWENKNAEKEYNKIVNTIKKYK